MLGLIFILLMIAAGACANGWVGVLWGLSASALFGALIIGVAIVNQLLRQLKSP